jgi:hypothetical protein
MKLFYLISGVLVLTFSTFWLFANLKLFDLEKSGTIVKMKIIDKPRTCPGTRAKYNMKVEYNGKVFIKEIASSVCEQYQVGDYIEMKYLKGEDQILYPHESFTFQFVEGVIFALLSVALIIYSFILRTKK